MPRARNINGKSAYSNTSKPAGNGARALVKVEGNALVTRDAAGRIEPGSHLNPAGPGLGVKNRIARVFLEDFHAEWAEGGRKAIEKLRKKDPRSFVYAALALVPKEMIVDETQRVYIIRDTPLTAEEWQQKHAGGVPLPEGVH